MFVGLSGEVVDCPEAVAAAKHRSTRTRSATRMREWDECVVDMSFSGSRRHELDGTIALELTRSARTRGARSGPGARHGGVTST